MTLRLRLECGCRAEGGEPFLCKRHAAEVRADPEGFAAIKLHVAFLAAATPPGQCLFCPTREGVRNCEIFAVSDDAQHAAGRLFLRLCPEHVASHIDPIAFAKITFK